MVDKAGCEPFVFTVTAIIILPRSLSVALPLVTLDPGCTPAVNLLTLPTLLAFCLCSPAASPEPVPFRVRERENKSWKYLSKSRDSFLGTGLDPLELVSWGPLGHQHRLLCTQQSQKWLFLSCITLLLSIQKTLQNYTPNENRSKVSYSRNIPRWYVCHCSEVLVNQTNKQPSIVLIVLRSLLTQQKIWLIKFSCSVSSC